MEAGFHRFTSHQEDEQNSTENSDESPMIHDTKAASTSSTKSRRGTKKRVVHVPIKEVERSRLKGETNAPPPDSWAWRKYGQKPIKGSPYPRGYYRCSSSKGCPARKQVERSWTDPTMVMVTYSCEHNHSPPASKNNNHYHHYHAPQSPPMITEATNSDVDDEQLEDDPPIPDMQSDIHEPKLEQEPKPESEPELESESNSGHQTFTSLEVESSCGPFGTATDQYGWFSHLESTSQTMLESPLMARDMVEDRDMTTIFSIREDEESFFADLGELPECTTVFRRREIERVEHHHRKLAPWCGTTG